jgi:hypothetical protein
VSSPEEPPARPEPVAVDAPAAPEPIPAVEPFDPPRNERNRHWPRLLAVAAPLLLPTASCLLALLVFVRLDHAFALVIAGALIVVAVIGLVRRVPFAGFWTVGLVVAGLLLRFS